jgi:hypothetical protein
MLVEIELNELRRRAGIFLKEAPITDEDLRIVERCAQALRVTLSDEQWLEIWKLLRQGVSPYSVLAEIGITGPGEGAERQ